MLHPSWASVRRRLTDKDDDESPRLFLQLALAGEHDPWRLLIYLADLGCQVSTLDDLLAAIADLDGEDDLFAVRVAEGVAVNQPSDGRWILFTP